MPTLFILCGPSGCGKTTWAEGFCHAAREEQDIRYVSRDSIRYELVSPDEPYFSHEREVFRIFSGTLAQTLVDGFDVIADATHLNSFSRKKLTKAIDRYTRDYRIVYVVFNTIYTECRAHNALREGRARVDNEVIKSMFRDFVAPTMQEDKRVLTIIEVGEKTNDRSYLLPERKDEDGVE